MSVDTPSAASPWPHRWAVLLCGLTLVLLWVGGLVTSTYAGMAVPDWPQTYGRNMFLYPWETWVFGPWDLRVEHGHRLLASLVGLVTIGLLATLWRCDSRPWMTRLGAITLGLVIFQGVLGGLRVVANERLIGMAHGCTGPAFFALTAALVVLTSRGWWRTPEATDAKAPTAGFTRLATLTAGLAYGQLVLGAALRHVGESVDPWTFASLVKLHLVMAAVVTAHTLAVAWIGWKRGRRRLGPLLGLTIAAQVTLGFATWLAKYGRPRWASDLLPATIDPITAVGWEETRTVTAHASTGSLLLGLLVATAVLAARPRPSARSLS